MKEPHHAEPIVLDDDGLILLHDVLVAVEKEVQILALLASQYGSREPG